MSLLFPKRKLSFSEISLIPETCFYLFIFRLKVSFQPSVKWMPKATTEISENTDPEKMESAQLITGIIDGLENRTPWKNTCLVKALTAHRMLKKRDIHYKIHIGVAPSPNNQLKAHAWLSVGNNIILGGGNLSGYFEISGFK